MRLEWVRWGLDISGDTALARIPVLAYAMASAFVSALGHIIWLQPWLVQEQSLTTLKHRSTSSLLRALRLSDVLKLLLHQLIVFAGRPGTTLSPLRRLFL